MYTVPKDTQPDKKSVEAAIKKNEEQRIRYNLLESYYTGEHPILARVKGEGLKNNRTVINHAEYITDVNVGYLMGNPIEYQTHESSTDIKPVTEEYRKQTITRLDSELAEDCSIFGRAYELVYANEQNQVKSKAWDVRNCIVVYDDTVEHNKLFAITYGAVNEAEKTYYDVVVYTATESIKFSTKLEPGERKPHYFGVVPVVEYLNNKRARGDFEGVITLIDAYNILQSDRLNDKEQLVDAILVFYGLDMTKTQTDDLRKNRLLTAPADAKIEYLIKQLDEKNVDTLRDRFEKDIHKISKTPNLSDENFVGNSSGVAIRYKLFVFEQNVKKKERSFDLGLFDRFRAYNNYLVKASKMGLVENYDVYAVFKRNLPQNDLEMSQIYLNLKDGVSEETLLSQISFVEDAKNEIESVKKQKEEAVKMAAEQFGTTNPTTQANPNNPVGLSANKGGVK